MPNYYIRSIAVSIALITSASGCSVYQDKRNTDAYSAQMMGSTKSRVSDNLYDVSREQKRASQDVNLPFLAGKARPISRDVLLPAALRGNIDTTTVYPGGGLADLVTLAQRVQDASGIMVRVTPDALMPLEAFSPRLTDKAGDFGTNPVLAPTLATTAPLIGQPLPNSGQVPTQVYNLPRGASPKTVSAGSIATGTQALPVVLDAIASRLGVYWKYDYDQSEIVFYRTETRIFEIRGAEMNAQSSISVGLTGSIGDQNSSSLDSKSKTSIDLPESKTGQTAEIVNRVKQFMTRAGDVSSGTGGIIIVTDTKGALDQIEKYIALENTIRSRTIDFVLEEITVENTKSSQAGVSWNLFFNSGGKGNEVNIGGLNSLLEQEGAAASFGASVGSGPWANSSVAVQALSKLGKVINQKTDSWGSNNGQPATTARPERIKYIDKLEQTPSFSDNSRPTISVTQAVEVSGRIITIIPNAYANGDINLAFKFDNTPTPVIEKQTLPDGSYVQSPRSQGTVLARTAIVHSGQPYVISAQMASNNSYDARRVDGGAPMALGGSDVADQSERVTILVLTAMIREK